MSVVGVVLAPASTGGVPITGFTDDLSAAIELVHPVLPVAAPVLPSLPVSGIGTGSAHVLATSAYSGVLPLVLATGIGVVGLWLLLIPQTLGDHRRVPAFASVRAVGGGLGVSALLAFVSGWVVPAVAAGLCVGLSVTRTSKNSSERSGSRSGSPLEALASWVESVRDLMSAGEQPIGAISASVPAASPEIQPAVRQLAHALVHDNPASACAAFADEIDDPVGDLIALGLTLAIERGARTVSVFDALAAQARHAVERRRLVDAERAPIRREATLLIALMLGLFGVVLLSGRSSYLAAYDSVTGQVVLAGAVVVFATLVERTRSLATFPAPVRIMVAQRYSRSPQHTSEALWRAGQLGDERNDERRLRSGPPTSGQGRAR